MARTNDVRRDLALLDEKVEAALRGEGSVPEIIGVIARVARGSAEVAVQNEARITRLEADLRTTAKTLSELIQALRDNERRRPIGR